MDLHFYGAVPVYWPLEALYNTCQIHPFTYTFIHWHWWQRLPCKVPAAHQEQVGVQYLAQRHFNTQLGGARIRASDPQITRRPALPPELQPPLQWGIEENEPFFFYYVCDVRNLFIYLIKKHLSALSKLFKAQIKCEDCTRRLDGSCKFVYLRLRLKLRCR